MSAFAGHSAQAADLVRALGVKDLEQVSRVVVDIPVGGLVTVYVQRVGGIDVPTAIEILGSAPMPHYEGTVGDEMEIPA